jgi:hypothetical protein
MQAKFILYAPNVHTGGGLTLLNELLKSWPLDRSLRVVLDFRAAESLLIPPNTEVKWVKPHLLDRLGAEFYLSKISSNERVTVLCFHSLPPLFPFRGNVIVFAHNRLLIESSSLSEYPFKIRTRIQIERLWSRSLQNHSSRYIVQTPSMAALLSHWLRYDKPISVLPYVPPLNPHLLFQKIASIESSILFT